MTLGTNNKKQVYVLIGFGVLAAYLVYTNVLSGPPSVPAADMERAAPAAGADAAAPSAPAPAAAAGRGTRAPSRAHGDEFHPVYIAKRPEDRPDPTRIDPTLRLDLFAKVQAVGQAGGSRNLFLFATAPPKEPAKLAGAEPLVNVHVFQGPRLPAPPPPPPQAPPPPPITLKFYGFSTVTVNGRKLGYFLDGEDILLAGEGDTMKKRYRVVRIGPNAAVLEDLDARREQSVPLTAEGPA